MKHALVLLTLLLVACQSRAAPQPTPAPDSVEAVLEKTVRHYYEVVNQVRSTGDASLVDAVTDPDGVDRSNIRAFVLDQQGKHKVSKTTREVFSNWRFIVQDTTAKVYFDYQASGYDIDIVTRQPLESEVTLAPDHLVIELRRHGVSWLVFNRQRA